MSTAHNGTHLSNRESRKHSNRQVSGGPPPVRDAMQNGGEAFSTMEGWGVIYQAFIQTQEKIKNVYKNVLVKEWSTGS